MSNSKEQGKLPAARLERAIEGFQAFCEEDLDWRKNSGEEFDEVAFNEAREVIMQRLNDLKEQTP